MTSVDMPREVDGGAAIIIDRRPAITVITVSGRIDDEADNSGENRVPSKPHREEQSIETICATIDASLAVLPPADLCCVVRNCNIS